MSWAAQRRFFILLIIGTIAAAFIATVSIATFYKEPSCTDSVQNQGEAGVDCGGPCAYLCTALLQPPTILFTQTLQNREGRIDIVAKVENKNATAAAKGVPYRITLYGAGQAPIRQITGQLDLPPGARIPIFVPGVAFGKQLVTNAFLDIASSSLRWFSLPADPRIMPVVSNTKQGGTSDAPRIEAVLTNQSVAPLTNVRVIVLVHNDRGDVIAASATIVPLIPAQGQATAIFTWNEPFRSVPAAIEVVPIVLLP